VERSSGTAPPRRPGVKAQGRSAESDLLKIEFERPADGFSIVALAGELDLSTIPQLEPRLLDELREQGSVVADLTRLRFIDSSGIGLLIKAHRVSEDGGAPHVLHIVVSDGSQVERVFALAGIGKAIPIFVDRAEAIAALTLPAELRDRGD
jgi:anti-anti-sigma factor